MGYRSEVVLALRPDASILLSTVIARGGPAASMFDADDVDVEKRPDGSVIYHWHGIKWYDSYPEIQVVEKFMQRLEDESMDESYRFVRIGEDTDDSDTRGWGFDINISRAIEFYDV